MGGGVPGHHQGRQVAGRTSGNEAPAGPRGESGQVGEDAEGLVLGGHRSGRLHPRRSLQRRAGHHHVEEQGGLGRRGRDEREEARAVAGDHRGGQLVVEDLHDPPRVGSLRVDQPVAGWRSSDEAWAPPKSSGHRVEGQAPPAVVEDQRGELLVVDEHRISHGVLSRAHVLRMRRPVVSRMWPSARPWRGRPRCRWCTDTA